MPSLSMQAARRKEYPEQGFEYIQQEVEEIVDGKKQKVLKQVKKPGSLTDVFYLTFKHPVTDKWTRVGISYASKRMNIAPEDIRNFEAENNIKPAIVQKELYYRKNTQGLWQEILGAKMTPDCYEDVTFDYYDKWRPEAYQGMPDELGPKRPGSPNPDELKIHMMEKMLNLSYAREQGRSAQAAIFWGKDTPVVKGEISEPLT